MYDYDESSVTIDDDGIVLLDLPGRRRRKLGPLTNRKVWKELFDRDLALLELWAYTDAKLKGSGLRKYITLHGTRSGSRPEEAYGKVLITFMFDGRWAKKRWGMGDWEQIARILDNRLEQSLPLQGTGYLTYVQILKTHWYFSVPLGSADQADVFIHVMVEAIDEYPAILESLK